MTKHWVKRGLAATALCGAVLLVGCGNFGSGFFQNPNQPTGTTTAGGDYVYSVNSDSTISGFEVGTDTLTAIAGNPVSPGSAYSATVTRPDTYLYVGGASAIYCFSIGSTGGLTQQTSGGFSGATTDYLALDTSPNGNYLVTLSQIAGQDPVINVLSINTSTCALTSQASATIPVPGNPALGNYSLQVSANNEFIGVALGAYGDYIYPLATNGSLGTAVVLDEVANSEDNVLTFDPSTSFAYIGRYGLAAGTGTVVTYGLSSSGALTQAGSVSAGNTVKSLLFNEAGTYLYAANFSDGTISGYSDASGVLTQATGSPFEAPAGVTALARDNSGKYVISAATGGTDLTLYAVDAINPAQLDAVATAGNGAATGSTSTAVAATH